MKAFGWFLAALLTAPALGASAPNFADARWETVQLSMFGQNGLKVDKLTGEAWYLEKVNKDKRWVSIPGPLTAAARKTMTFGENFTVQASGPNVYLIGIRGGDSWRLADNRGKPYWRKIQ